MRRSVGSPDRMVIGRKPTPRRRFDPSVVTGGVAFLVRGCSAATATTPTVGTHATDSPPVLTSCTTSSAAPTIVLGDMTPAPTLSVPVGAVVVVLIHSPFVRAPEKDTAAHIQSPLVLKQLCSVLLPDHGERTLLSAIGTGTSGLDATITPPTQVMMPAWSGTITVTS